MSTNDRLFTPRFFLMSTFTFTVFLSVFQLIPTAPFHLHDLGGGALASGLFLGFLTFASAWSAPFTGAFADRFGRRRTLIVASLGLAAFTASYAVITNYRLLLALVLVHGVVWSSLLVASAAYLTSILPASRRGEGIAYWGLASVLAVAMAPSIGFWVFSHGWVWLCVGTTGLNLVMAAIAWSMEDDRGSGHAPDRIDLAHAIEWRVVALSTPLFLYTYSYGAVSSFSAYYTAALGIRPQAIYLTTMALVTLVSRPVAGRFGDRLGHRRLFMPSLVIITAGMLVLSLSSTRGGLVAAAALFALGFGTAYPAFAAWVMLDIHESRRAAAFGAILAAYDTGIGSGSTLTGWLIGHRGFGTAFGVAAALSALALPTFLVVERRFGHSPWKPEPETTPPPGDPLYAPAPFEE
jgi:MFS family permease